MTTPTKAKYDYIDVTRAIAILMVVITHAFQGQLARTPFTKLAALGQFGVQLFFVASALTLCLSAQSRGVEGFFKRRFWRIAPMYYLGIILYGAYSLCVQSLGLHYRLGAFDEHFTAANILSNLTFIHGFVPSAQNFIVPGGWSIGAEMAFYALFPVLFQKIVQGNRSKLALIIYSIALLVVVVLFHGVAIDSFWYYSIFVQLPAFFWGCLLFERLEKPLKNSEIVMGGVALLLTAAAWSLQSKSTFISPFVSAIHPLSSGCVFFVLIRVLKKVSKFPEFLLEIGRVSFSMYVVHFIFAWEFMRLLNTTTWNPYLCLALNAVATVICAYAVARFTMRYVEKPCIARGAK